MKASNYNKQAIKDIVLSCKHTEKATQVAIESYIAERNRMYGEFSVGEFKISVVLDNHYDEYTGELIGGNWQTTVMVKVDDSRVYVTFD